MSMTKVTFVKLLAHTPYWRLVLEPRVRKHLSVSYVDSVSSLGCSMHVIMGNVDLCKGL